MKADQIWREKFAHHKGHAKERGLESHLSFDDYVRKAHEAGLTSPNQIGRLEGQYQLGRVGDTGNYDDDNCRFIPMLQNFQEARENGRLLHVDQLTRDRQAGQTKETSEQYRKVSQALTGQTVEVRPHLADLAKQATERFSKPFVVTDPEGNVYMGENLSEFCRTHNLHRGHMSAVCGGSLLHHKGWTGQYEPIFSAYFHEIE